MLKEQNGITLVALVIIIVLLIVVVTVAISFAFGNNGWGTSNSDIDAYAANMDYKIDAFMNETETKLQEIEANVSSQQELVEETTNEIEETNDTEETNDLDDVVNEL